MFVYTTSEFRKNMRTAMNLAESGAEVVIDRHDKRFTLTCTDESAHIPTFYNETSEIDENALASIGTPPALNHKDGKVVVGSTPTQKNSLAKAKQEVANLQAQQAIDQKRMKMDGLKFCKAGHILSSNGKCLQKGCKYGK